MLLSQTDGILSLQVCAPPPSSSKITEYINKLKTAQRTAFRLACQRGRVLCVVFALSAHEKQTRFRKRKRRLFTRTKYTIVHITYFLTDTKWHPYWLTVGLCLSSEPGSLWWVSWDSGKCQEDYQKKELSIVVPFLKRLTTHPNKRKH